jgi:branched-chain amino acid transport system substrate-binding protein
MPCRLRLLKVLMLLLASAATPAGGAAAQSPVNIIVTGPATGRYAEYLGAMIAAAQRAATALSSAETADGAMLGAISVTDVDDGCEADRARGAAGLIVGMKPDLVIGHPCPAAAIAAAPIYAEAGVVFIALGVRHPELTDKRAGPTIFRLSGREDRQGEAAAAVLSRSAPEGRIAIVQDRTAYARSLLEDTTVALEKLKRPAPVVIPIVAGRRDYSVEIEKLVLARAEAVFFAGYPSEAAVLLRGMRRAGLYAVFIGSDANATSEFADTVVQG